MADGRVTSSGTTAGGRTGGASIPSVGGNAWTDAGVRPITEQDRINRANAIARGEPVKQYAPGVEYIPAGTLPDGSIPQSTPQSIPLTQESYLESLLAQQRAEAAARQARVAEATAAINAIFGNRAGVFDQYADEVYGMSADRLGEEQTDATRNLKFALARSGLTGGSVDVDKRADVEQSGQRGLLEARSYADREAARLASAEEQARQSLLGLAGSGNVTGAQVSGLARGMQETTNSALSAPTAQPGLAQVFAGLTDNIGRALFARGLQNGFAAGFPGGSDQSSSFVRPGNSRSAERGTITPSS